MLSTKEIVKEAESLPVEERAVIIDCLLRTMNPLKSKIDKQWIHVAKRRLKEIRSGKAKTIPVEDVFDRVKKRFST
ncbi:MAG: addiction module protein [Kiritimatiellae bacterium]|nr:addiction module protein [Kiritimatiellia bacterium]